MSSAQKKLVKKIKSIRKELGISQEELAFRCGLDRSYIGRVETFKRMPKLDTLEKLAKGLDIPLHELLKFE